MGQDIKGTRIASGNNIFGVGIKFPGSVNTLVGSGIGRFIDVDSWGNLIGMEISDTAGYVFFGLNLGANAQVGLHICQKLAPGTGFIPGDVRIIKAIFGGNSTAGNGLFSDILLEPNTNGYGPYDIALIGCEFHGGSPPYRTKYAIEDTSTIPRRCIITGGFFAPSNYTQGISNKPQAIRDCYNNDTADILTQSELPYSYVTQNNYTPALGDGFLYVDASQAPIVKLPLLNAVPVGRVFYIANASPTAALTIQAQSGQMINEVSSVTLSGQRTAYMIIQAGSEWIGIRVA